MRLVNVRGLNPSRAGGLETVFREVVGRTLAWRPDGLAATILTCSQSHESFAPWRTLAELRQLPDDATGEELAREIADADLLHYPLIFLELWEAQIPAVVFIPDLQHEVSSESFGTEILALRTRGLCAGSGRSEAAITISESSAEQIRSSFRLPEDRVVLIHPDAPESFRTAASPLRLAELRTRLAASRCGSESNRTGSRWVQRPPSGATHSSWSSRSRGHRACSAASQPALRSNGARLFGARRAADLVPAGLTEIAPTEEEV